MSPRRYRLGRRQAHVEESRQRVVEAARSLLAEASSYTAFTVDAVARRANVARATVYYQFGSKTGLLEAVCDALAEAGQMSGLAAVFTTPDPHEALRRFIAVFTRFWSADRDVMRRLRALACLDPDVRAVIRARDDRNRQGLRVLVGRLAQQPGAELHGQPEALVAILHVLTSFETFDALAGSDRDPTELVDIIVALAESALRLPMPGRTTSHWPEGAGTEQTPEDPRGRRTVS